MRDYGEFTFGKNVSREFNIIMTEAPPIIIAERDVENVSVAGISGNLTVDKGRYKNVTVPYRCAIIPKDGKKLRDCAIEALELLRPAAGYMRLENSFHQDSYRMARITGQVSIESIVEKAGRFTVEFYCKPQRFLIDGEAAVSFSKPSSLFNHTNEIALPLITVYGNGAGELSVGGVTVSILVLEDQITLDCEIQNAYRKVGDAPPENKNVAIAAPTFPSLNPGINAISWTGEITKVEIIPRWWTL